MLIHVGGMSFFPNLYGLGADSVENFKVCQSQILENH